MILRYSREAREQIRILPPELKNGVKGILEDLRDDPYQGKPLKRELEGFWSIPFRRYRIIYHINSVKKEIRIYSVGHRREIYWEFSARGITFA